MHVTVNVYGDILVVREDPHYELAVVPLPPDEEAAGVMRDRGVEARAGPTGVHCVHPASPLLNGNLNTEWSVTERRRIRTGVINQTCIRQGQAQ